MSDLQVEPHLFVVMGGTGDLMQRKLLPALARLVKQGLLHNDCHILGVARNQDHTDESFRKWALDALASMRCDDESQREAIQQWILHSLHYQSIANSSAEDFRHLAQRIQQLEHQYTLPGNRAFYLALPPKAFPPTIMGLGGADLCHSNGWTRVTLEKPFGTNLSTATQLNQLLHKQYDESQIYRIDHYLGKETVQNLIVFRFANAIFESLWNRDRIDNVQITVGESVGVDGRGGYYDQSGAIRDMMQNHLLQLLTLTAMEVPAVFEADAIRYEKNKVLRSIRALRPEDVVLGQYIAGDVDGEVVKGYQELDGISPHSTTETYAAMRVHIENWRWQGVPFYLRTGKRLPRRTTQIIVTFRQPPVSLFHPFRSCAVRSNELVITLQPNEGFDLRFEVKAPGEPIAVQTQKLNFRYEDVFAPLPDAYETLLLDIMQGDQTLFVHADEAENSWRLFTPVLQMGLPNNHYAAGTWGPEEADFLLHRDGRRWRTR